jgi:hypothetical protein
MCWSRVRFSCTNLCTAIPERGGVGGQRNTLHRASDQLKEIMVLLESGLNDPAKLAKFGWYSSARLVVRMDGNKNSFEASSSYFNGWSVQSSRRF